MQYLPEDLQPRAAEIWHKLRLRLKLLWRRLVPPIERERRAEIQVQLRDQSEGDFDYFVLVFLSCMIATFGLLIDSAATIIGAMLVAPLMSPILGLGLASLRGDTTLLRNAAIALGRGALLSILLSVFLTLINDWLPFITLQELPGEILARTRPSPIDLGVALAGGLAAAFALAQPGLSAALPGVAIATALMPPLSVVGIGIALGRWDVAGGSFLLFITNAVTIAAAAMLVFFSLGFNPPRREGEGFLPRSLLLSFLLMGLLLGALGIQSYQFVREATQVRRINEVVDRQVNTLLGESVRLLNPEPPKVQGDTVFLVLNVQTSKPLEYQDSIALRDAIAGELQRSVQLQINQVFADVLDPAVPPTFTPTPTVGPSPTVTETPPPASPTPFPTLTQTPAPTLTPTFTPTLTPTPAIAIVSSAYGDGISLRQYPNGPIITFLPAGTYLTVLYGYEIVDGWVWIEVMDPQGLVGWVPQFLTDVVTLTPSPTSKAPTASPTKAPTLDDSTTPTPSPST